MSHEYGMEVTISEMQQLIKLLAIDDQQSLMFWGPSGVGKTQGIFQLAVQCWNEWVSRQKRPHGYYEMNPFGRVRPPNYVDLRLSQLDSVDLRGTPWANPKAKLTDWYAPAILPVKGNPNFYEGEDYPLFLVLEELTTAPREVQAAAYQLTLERCSGEHVLMDNVVILATSNREADRGVSFSMPWPLANRFTHFEVTVSAQQWVEYAAGQGISAVPLAFVLAYPDKLNGFDPNKADRAQPSPRSLMKAFQYWENGSLAEPLKQKAMAGAIGYGTTLDFYTFAENYRRLPKPKQILADPDGTPVPAASDMCYAIALMISNQLSSTDGNASTYHRYLSRMRGDYQMLAWQGAVKRDVGLFKSDEYIDVCKKHSGMLIGRN